MTFLQSNLSIVGTHKIELRMATIKQRCKWGSDPPPPSKQNFPLEKVDKAKNQCFDPLPQKFCSYICYRRVPLSL